MFARILAISLGSFLLTLPAHVYGQGTGTIQGMVTDDTGAVIPGVTVELINENTGVRTIRVSDANGRYRFPQVLVGHYRIEAELSGFRRSVSDSFELDVEATLTTNVQMEVGEITDEVTVAASAGIQTEGGTLIETIDEKRIAELPLNGRNALQLQLLVPGVVESVGGTTLAREDTFTINGQKGISNTYLLDGGDNNDVNNGSAAVTPNPDALAEYSVLTSNYGAQYGRNLGGVINAVTKSGTNALHGTLSAFLRNDALDARDFFAVEKGDLERNHFGGTIGGPIVRDRTFFFTSYQGTRERVGRTDSSITSPTEAMRRGDFSDAPIAPIDPETGERFPQDQIPADRFDPAAVSFLDIFVPLPNTPSGQFVFNAQEKDDDDQFLARIDHQLTGNQRLFGRWFQSDVTTEDVIGLPLLSGQSEWMTRNMSVNHSYTVSPTLVTSVQFTFSQTDLARGPLPIREDLAPGGLSLQDIGVNVPRGAPQDLLEELGIATPNWRGPDVSGYFEPEQINWEPINRQTYEVRADVSKIMGNHSLTVGGELRWLENNRVVANAVDPTFDFNGSVTGDAFADFLLGRASQVEQNGVRVNEGRGRNVSLYIQDDYKLRRNVTLSLGLRWDPHFPFYDDGRRNVVFRPGQASQILPNAPLGMLFPGDPGVPKGGADVDWTNFAPRLAIAWTPLERTSIRAAYGIFFDTPRFFGALSSAVFSPPFTASQVNFDVSFSNPYAQVENSPFPFVTPETEEELRNFQFPSPVRIGQAVPEEFSAGYSQQWNLNIERELPQHIVMTAAYVGSRSLNQPILREINPAVFIPGTDEQGNPLSTVGNTNERRTYPDFQSLQSFDNVAESWYHGLQLTAKKRFGQGYTFLANYTFSKALDFSSTDAYLSNQDPLNIEAEKGRAAFDVRHRFVTSFLWELPNPFSPGIAREVLGGWQLNGIFTAQSGTPFNVVTGGDDSLTAFGSDRPDLVGDPALPGGRSREEEITRFFNVDAFALPEAGSFGDFGRNVLTGPGFWNLDFSVFKSFHPFAEDIELDFRAECFNILNHANLNNPVANIRSGSAGRILSTSPGRIIQLGLHLSF